MIDSEDMSRMAAIHKRYHEILKEIKDIEFLVAMEISWGNDFQEIELKYMSMILDLRDESLKINMEMRAIAHKYNIDPDNLNG